MSILLLSIIQSTILGTVSFIVLLCFKKTLLKRCGARIWQLLLLCNTVLFVLPIDLMNRAIAPMVLPIRTWFRDLLSSYEIPGSHVVRATNQNLATHAALIWIIGAVIYLLVRWIIYVSYVMHLKSNVRFAPLKISDIFENQVRNDKKFNKRNRLSHTKIYVHDDLISPVVYGFWRKKIVLPGRSIENYCPDEIYLMLRHEAVHIIHGDAWKRLFTLLIHSANWFNPVLLLLNHNINEGLELYCDSVAVGVQADDDARHEYSELLITLIDNHRRRSVLGMFMANKTFITKRIIYIMTPVKRADKFFLTLTTLTLALLMALCLTGFAAASDYGVETYWVGTTDTGIEIPNPIYSDEPEVSADSYNLSEQDIFIFEQQIYADIVNHVPIDFSTNTTGITLQLLSGGGDVTVYLYNAVDKDYPLMLSLLSEGKNIHRFTGLSDTRNYALGLLTDEDKVVKIKVQD